MSIPKSRTFDLVINDASIFDGSKVRTGTFSVGIDNGMIAALSDEALNGSATIDARGSWLSPGLIDSHVHMYDPMNVADEASMSEYLDVALPGHLRSFLEWGITTIKSVGDPVPELLEARRRLNAGECVGPRFLMTGFGITSPGGHPTRTIYGRNPWYQQRAVGEATTAQDARARVSEMADLGMDAIKILYQGGCACQGEAEYKWHGQVPILRLKRRPLEAAIDEAHRRGLKATVHTFEQSRVIEALEAGADGVEHGVVGEIISDNRVFDLLLKNNASYVPTLWVYSTPEAHRNLALVRDAGARIALGTDSFSPTIKVEGIDAGRYGSNSIVEAERMVAAGLTPLEALRAATGQAAVHLGRDDLGVIAEGKRADLVVLKSNPTVDISNLRSLQVVIANGRVVVDRRPASSKAGS
ncbi:amidohydrolase family protein [Ramlibacter sp. WS9]|uniref:amidohydrolase family protein n=1 Tax=Ramlibacter sp. WS9 TaxID=1882741 RepID=UPI001143AA53|nr:amidohydrolase family protein [Ramlibacter sp. WS9]ROZ75093.1 amidohydrolase [Ramlibacter sp. WS9]